MSRAGADSLIPAVRRLISEIAGGPFGPIQLTSYRFPDGRHEIHLDVGPERAIRLAGVGPTPLAAAAALLVVVEREMVARRLDRWRARTSG